MTRSIHRFGLCVSLVTLISACGDGGGTSGTGGSAGSTTTTGGGGTGGSTGGSTTSTGGSTGGSTTSSGGSTTSSGGSTGGSTTSTGGSTGGSTTTTGGGGAGGSTTSTGGSATGGAGGTTTSTGGSMTTTTTGGGVGGSDQITAVRAAADGAINEMVQGVLVTYTKPLLGQDPAGFFVQAEAAGPAIFVAVDPQSLNPPVKAGDDIDFVATEIGTAATLRQVTAITGLVVNSSNNDVLPLVTDVSMSADVVTSLDGYESRAIKITGDLTGAFVSAGAPQVAAKITTMGADDMNLRLRMPEAVRGAFDLTMACNVTVDYGVMWRFNAVAQPSVYDTADLMNMTCPQPTVTAAVPMSANEVVIKFDRVLDANTVEPADFTFDNGLMAQTVMVNGKDVTVTTSPQAAGITYTVTASTLADLLGAQVGVPNMATFQSYVPVAGLLINETNPNIGSSRDLLELLVTSAGSVNGVTIVQNGSAEELLATLPDVSVAMGDLIVIHLNPAGATGAAPGSELLAKNQYANAMFSANYDGAWDFHGGTTGLSFSHRILEVRAPAGTKIDAVPFVLSNVATPPAAFPGDLQALQAAGGWLPADCGGVLCDYASTPTAVAISVDLLGCGNTATGNSVQRVPGGVNTKLKADWKAAGAHSFGLPNP